MSYKLHELEPDQGGVRLLYTPRRKNMRFVIETTDEDGNWVRHWSGNSYLSAHKAYDKLLTETEQLYL